MIAHQQIANEAIIHIYFLTHSKPFSLYMTCTINKIKFRWNLCGRFQTPLQLVQVWVVIQQEKGRLCVFALLLGGYCHQYTMLQFKCVKLFGKIVVNFNIHLHCISKAEYYICKSFKNPVQKFSLSPNMKGRLSTPKVMLIIRLTNLNFLLHGYTKSITKKK